MRHCTPHIIRSNAKRPVLQVGGLCPTKSMITPPWRYPRVASLACGRVMSRWNSTQTMFGIKMANTCGRCAGSDRELSFGEMKMKCGTMRKRSRGKEHLRSESQTKMFKQGNGE